MTRRFRSAILVIGSCSVVLCAGAWLLVHTTSRIRVGTAVVSHTLCSGAFLSGVDPDLLYAEAVKPIPGQAALSKRLKYDVDRANRQVTATWAGVIRSRAVYRDGFGCLLLHGDESRDAGIGKAPGRDIAAAAPQAEGSLEVQPPNPKLEAALDRAFAEPTQPPFRWVKAIVILRNGKLVAERYAPGYGVDTPILGYSLAKSVTNALIGILVRQKRLSVEQRAPVAEWDNPSDPRHAITIDQLLRMTSGLALEESDSGSDPVSRMLFLESDMAGYAERARLETPPGSKWDYSSGNTLILSRIIRDAVGGRAQDGFEFARKGLFEPLGITTATIEFDATGTPVGSIYIFASARDWARLGLLYLNDGVANGRRILPEGWVNYSAAPTLDTDYGAGFWTNGGSHGDASARIQAGMPEDSFYGSGNLGQRMVIIPSAGLVIVRLGLTHSPDFDMKGLLRLVADTSAALKRSWKGVEPFSFLRRKPARGGSASAKSRVRILTLMRETKESS
jgi:CubicO group peptidase (beta-lactamase class C family)